MKKLVVIIAILVAPIAAMAQDSLFDKYEDNAEVSSVVFTQKVFRMLAELKIELDDPDAKEVLDMASNITGLKVLTTGDPTVSAQMKADVERYLKTSKLEELMRVKDGDQTVKFYVREGKDDNHVKELLMFVTGLKEVMKDQDITINGEKRELETVLLSLTGDIDLRQVSKLANKMDVPGGKHLEKAKDKN
ncbi:MAG: DUF4252 domain-containing protein [Bacteroidia bacterium]|nr:DUF4252 domain-containing protein [Bacteroidia bacterium]NND25085.1 DUF4252 domain-containing protein [Flavobacteriaceae bacterium]MBT8279423.1 DUF4252 domain-containing protein [Bacteroidia bacterium]NNK59361.1 DUF4252 domain-containing protein [Flavobacteriaceae bacterium]NNL33384.1 DUF4252 domain-containing protein [Flavobacteriaceae bacterium]